MEKFIFVQYEVPQQMNFQFEPNIFSIESLNLV